MNAVTPNRPEAPAPVGLLAELTHRCPLRCPYCSNPLELDRRSGELDTATGALVHAGVNELEITLPVGATVERIDFESTTRWWEKAKK